MSADTQRLLGERASARRRSRASASGPATGEIVVNARPADEYFGRETSRMIIRQPFEVTSTAGQYRTDVNVLGGGVSAQAVAIRHGITRALLQVDPELRPRAQEGRLHHARLARGRAQEVRPAQGAQAPAVLQALSPRCAAVARRVDDRGDGGATDVR